MKIAIAESIRASEEQIKQFSEWLARKGHALVTNNTQPSAEEAVERATDADIATFISS